MVLLRNAEGSQHLLKKEVFREHSAPSLPVAELIALEEFTPTHLSFMWATCPWKRIEIMERGSPSRLGMLLVIRLAWTSATSEMGHAVLPAKMYRLSGRLKNKKKKKKENNLWKLPLALVGVYKLCGLLQGTWPFQALISLVRSGRE